MGTIICNATKDTLPGEHIVWHSITLSNDEKASQEGTELLYEEITSLWEILPDVLSEVNLIPLPSA